MPLKPKLGQNFLNDPSAAVAIVEALGDIASAPVLEIGPGRGAITGLLAARAGHLTVVELDRTLTPGLRERYPQIEVLEQDILATDISALAGDTPLAVVGNLPYYITSQILLHLFEHHHALRRAVIMVQREVADRIAASPGSRDYGLLTATTQLYARITKLLTLPPGAFSPPPEVHSTVLRLDFEPRYRELSVAPEEFIPFLRSAFAQKRKTLANNLRTAGYPAEAVASAFTAAGISPAIRAEALPLEASAALFRELGPRRAA